MNNTFSFVALGMLTLWLLGGCSLSQYQNYSTTDQSEQEMPNGSGCWTKSLISDKYEIETTHIYEYTGDLNQTESYKTIGYELKPASSKWVKKKADSNCLSSDPKDCLVWCLVETEAEFKEYNIVTDTTLTKTFKETKIDKKLLTEQGGFTKWIQVLCEKDLTPAVLIDLQDKLETNGYIISDIEYGEITKGLKKALLSYQYDNFLPQESFNLETLDSLGVAY